MFTLFLSRMRPFLPLLAACVLLLAPLVALADSERAERSLLIPEPDQRLLSSDEQPIFITRGTRAAAGLHRLALERGKSVVLRTEFGIKRLAVGDPTIVDFVLLGEREIQLVATLPGNTNLLIWEDGYLQAVIDIHVDTVDTRIVHELRRILDNPSIELDVVGASVILRGNVPSLEHFERAEMVANAFLDQIAASTGGSQKKGITAAAGAGAKSSKSGAQNTRLLNLLEVGGNHQVMIEVVIAELNRSVRHAMGVNLFGAIAIDDQKYATFQTLLKNMTSNPEIAIAPGTPAGMSAMTDSVTMAGTFFSSDSFDLRMFLEMVEANQLGSILAEPTLVARSGELANFLVGGETPIPIVSNVGAGTGTQYSIQFKKYGVNVEFTPTVLSEKRIHMQITSEVSEPDFSFGVRILGSAVPAFRTRRVNTTVALGDGQTFVMAGLLREDILGDVESVPLLGDIPILGNLFRSRAFQKNQSELVMIVTPRLVKPVGPERVELPTDHYIEPTKAEFYWDGLIQGRPERREDSDAEPGDDESDSDAAREGAQADFRAGAGRNGTDSSAALAHEQPKSTPGGLIGDFGHRLPVPAPTGGDM